MPQVWWLTIAICIELPDGTFFSCTLLSLFFVKLFPLWSDDSSFTIIWFCWPKIKYVLRSKVNSRRHMRRGFTNLSKFSTRFLSLIKYQMCLYLSANVLCLHRYWEPTYEDSLSLIAQLPVIASYVYRRLVMDCILIGQIESFM